MGEGKALKRFQKLGPLIDSPSSLEFLAMYIQKGNCHMLLGEQVLESVWQCLQETDTN
jgi:hypothetical protein